MSAHTEAGTQRAEQDAATSFLAKPFELDALTSVISKAIK